MSDAPLSFSDLFQQRDVGQAIKELRECTNGMTMSCEVLAKAYPGTVGIGAIVAGEVRGIFVLAPSLQGDHCSTEVVAMDRMKTWARLFGNLPAQLRSAFEAELAAIPQRESELNYVTSEQIANDDEARRS